MTTKRESLAGFTSVVKSKKIGNNTFEVIYQNTDRAIRLHTTDVITFKRNGNIVLNSGGWRTSTTKARINEHLNYAFSVPVLFQVYQVKYIWYVDTPEAKKVLFYDGITFNAIGGLVSLKAKG